MKKLFTLFMALVTSVIGLAQITLTDDALAPAGTTIYMAYDSIAENVLTPGAPGANMNWDFGILTAHNTDTVSLMLPTDTPYGSDFPLSNFAVGIPANDEYAYFSRNSSQLSNVGVAATTSEYGFVSTAIVPSNIYLDYPVTYGNSRQENYSMVIKIADNSLPGVDSVKYKTSTTEFLTVDAWGTMKLPIGVFDVLRQKEEKTVTDSIWTRFFGSWILLSSGVDEVDTYNWWTNDVGAGFTLCSFDVDRLTQEVTHISFLNSYTVGLPASPEATVVCYPNPTKDFVYVTLPDLKLANQVQVADFMGRAITVPTMTQENQLVIDVRPLPSGIYFVSIPLAGKSPEIRKIIKE